MWEPLSTCWNWPQEPKRISLLVKKFVNWTKFPYPCKWSFKLMCQGLTLALLYSCQYLISNSNTLSVVRAEWYILSPDWSILWGQTAESHLKGILWVILLFVLVPPPMMWAPTLLLTKKAWLCSSEMLPSFRELLTYGYRSWLVNVPAILQTHKFWKVFTLFLRRSHSGHSDTVPLFRHFLLLVTLCSFLKSSNKLLYLCQALKI